MLLGNLIAFLLKGCRGVGVHACMSWCVCVCVSLVKTGEISKSMLVILSPPTPPPPPRAPRKTTLKPPSVSLTEHSSGGTAPFAPSPWLLGRRNPSGLQAALLGTEETLGATLETLNTLASQWEKETEGAGVGRVEMAVLLFLYNKRRSL